MVILPSFFVFMGNFERGWMIFAEIPVTYRDTGSGVDCVSVLFFKYSPSMVGK